MKNKITGYLLPFLMLVPNMACGKGAQARPEKEWTILVYLNGHNNLDSFGKMNVNQMLEVGSTADVNIVVEWASEQNGKTKRIYIEKGTYKTIEEMAPVDMGDYKSLVEFAKWGHEKFPAKKYMIDVWSHGNGWHLMSPGAIQTRDISYDDLTNHKITTEQLGVAMKEIATLTGKKVELYASDACLMSMAEVANEMIESVSYFAGSQETEPGEGWPYNTFLHRVVAAPTMNGGDVAKVLAEEYLKAYSGGIYGKNQVTFSAFDMAKLANFNQAMAGFSSELMKLDAAGLQKANKAIDGTEAYALSDYKDLVDYLKNVGAERLPISERTTAKVKTAVEQLVISNQVSSNYANSHGVSVWLPGDSYSWKTYGKRYQNLYFNKQSNWAGFLEKVVQIQ